MTVPNGWTAPIPRYPPNHANPLGGAVDYHELNRPLYGAKLSQGIRRFFRKFADFRGRASKSEFWWGMFIFAMVRIAPYPIMIVIAVSGDQIEQGSADYDTFNAVSVFAGLIVMALFIAEIVLIVPLLAVTWRRLHDANLPGPWALLSFIPLFGQIVLFVMVLMPSVPAGRRFDQPPLFYYPSPPQPGTFANGQGVS